MYQELIDGSFYVKPGWLDWKLFNNIRKSLPDLKYKPIYQPSETYYGNRFQAYPCYEIPFAEYHSIFISQFETTLKKRIDKKGFKCNARKAITEEVSKSKVDTRWGIVHRDSEEVAAILYFDQTSTGGTVFFEHMNDKYPDISFGAYPNRLLMYAANRWHTTSTDFTFKERYVLAFSFNILKE